VDRTSSGNGAVSAFSLAELRALDFGDGHGVLTLHALLDLVTSSAADAMLFVETKHPASHGDAVETRLAAMLEEFGLTAPRDKANSRVVMMSFSSRAVGRFRELLPRVPTVLLFSWLQMVSHDGSLPHWVDIAGPDIDLLRQDPDYVRRARAHAHPTYCWTVDDAADVRLCREAGVGYVATNDPGEVRRLLSGQY
jgi:glycerophosphoryl diester phosphodiesterase